MSKSIVLACYEVPGYGGASTATYQLSQRMRRDNLDVTFVNLVDAQDADYFRYVFGEKFGNPDNLPHVENLIMSEPLHGPQPGLADLLEQKSPELLLGVDWIAALLLKKAAPATKTVFMTAGCQIAQDLIFRDGPQALDRQKLLEANNVRVNIGEREAVQLADLLITHSHLTQSLYQYFYSSYAGKILSEVIWKAEWILDEAQRYAHLSQPFDKRDIDVLFIASNWSRQEKNYELVTKIAASVNARVHIIGEVNKPTVGVTTHHLTGNRRDLFELMGRAKSVVCPSLFDAAPGILFEASAMGCNVIASRNCGNWQICNDELLVDPPNAVEFVKAIERSLSCKFDDHMDYFLKANSYQTFLETIAVL